MATLIGNCKTCGHDQTKHKGIDGELRIKSRCTGLQINESATEKLGRTVSGPLRCRCDNYVTTWQKERKPK